MLSSRHSRAGIAAVIGLTAVVALATGASAQIGPTSPGLARLLGWGQNYGSFYIGTEGTRTIAALKSPHRYRVCALNVSKTGERTTLVVTADGQATNVEPGFCADVHGATISISSTNPVAGLNGTYHEID